VDAGHDVGAMTTPNGWSDKPLPKRNGARGLLPSTWLQRELRLDYVDADGAASTATGVLLDWFPLGPVLNVGGTRTLLSWDAIKTIELVEEGWTVRKERRLPTRALEKPQEGAS
jgi:hypothetical protein